MSAGLTIVLALLVAGLGTALVELVLRHRVLRDDYDALHAAYLDLAVAVGSPYLGRLARERQSQLGQPITDPRHAGERRHVVRLLAEVRANPDGRHMVT